MAQRVFGIDLGSYAVKVAEMDVGFRGAGLVRLHTQPVALGPEPPLVRSIAALEALGRPWGSEVVTVSFPGDRVLLRLLEMPVADPRKLGPLVANELADDIPWELEEAIFDYAALPEPAGRVLAAVVRSVEVGETLQLLSAHGVDPRSLLVAPLAYGALLRGADPSGVVLVDIGHLRTNVCLVREGRVLAARTVLRAGHQITEAFRQSFQLSYVEAEAFKEREAIVSADEGELDAEKRQIVAVATGALAPLVREIRLSVSLLCAKIDFRPERVVLCGGTSLLPGLDRLLGAELNLPAVPLALQGAVELGETALTREGEAMAASAMGVAMEHGGRRTVELRQGEFAFKTDRSVFTEKLVFLAVSLVAVLLFAALNAYVSLYALRKQEKGLSQQLKQLTKDVLGRAVTKPRTASKEVKQGCRAQGSGIPSRTALDILDYLSREIPGGDKVKLDIVRLDIKPGKTYLKGTADSRSAVADIVTALQKNKCFSNVTSGTISDVSEGKKQFSLTITTECF